MKIYTLSSSLSTYYKEIFIDKEQALLTMGLHNLEEGKSHIILKEEELKPYTKGVFSSFLYELEDKPSNLISYGGFYCQLEEDSINIEPNRIFITTEPDFSHKVIIKDYYEDYNYIVIAREKAKLYEISRLVIDKLYLMKELKEQIIDIRASICNL